MRRERRATEGARARATRPGHRLLAVAGLFAFALAAVGTLLAISSYHAQRERAIDGLSVRAQASVDSAGMFVASRLELLGVAAADPVFATGDGRRIDVALSRMGPAALGFTGGLAWVAPNGIVRAATAPAVVGHDVSRENVMLAAARGRAVVGALDRSAALEGAVVPLAAPTKDLAGERNGELLAGIGDAFIRSAAATASERYLGDVGILDRAGRLIAGPDVVAPRPVGGPLIRRARDEASGTAVNVVGVSGRPDRIVGWGSTEPAGWTLFLERSAGAVLGPPIRRLVLTLVVLLLLVAALLATAWAVARRLDRTAARDFGVALRLQLSLLPDVVPDVAGADVAVRYRPGTKGLEVGGDWYDVVDLGDGRAGVCVGDIVGRGLNAAVVMGRLRSALSALAVTGAGPAGVLRGLERFVQHTDATGFATVAYAEVDPCAGRMRYGCAGHPPPLVVGPDGDATFLDEARGTPLGTFADLNYDEAEATLPAGAVLVLYTDGLVERRDEPIDRSLERLRVLAAGHAGESAGELADALLGAFAGAPADDVAVLCLRVRDGAD
jgi:Stage II sporulation protein E (SpoIIE)